MQPHDEDTGKELVVVKDMESWMMTGDDLHP
jgi:hypothetical protein